ncbi:hypothetical protein MTO96_016998 [Rhipicephalus appendiculatus]
MVRKRFSSVHVLTIPITIVAAVLDRASSGDRKKISYDVASAAAYGYPHRQHGIAGAWWRPWPVPDETRVMLACSGIEFRMRYWQNFHMDTRDWFDLGYSFLIGGDGRVYVARGWDASGAHTKGHNEDALAASFIGDFSRHLPTPRAIWALHRLLQCGVALGKIRPDYTVHGHRDAGCTSCPGDALYAYISRWANFGGKLQKYICSTPGSNNRSVPH